MRRRTVGIALGAVLFTSVLAPTALANGTSAASGVEITSPTHLSSYEAGYDAAAGLFGAKVQLTADVASLAPGVTVAWFSSDEGFLGLGETIEATLHISDYDSAQPTITARVLGADSIQADEVQVSIWHRSPNKCPWHKHWWWWRWCHKPPWWWWGHHWDRWD